jgi:hypothetical protein
MDELFANTRLNLRVPHLKDKSIFELAKNKVNLLPRNKNNSHLHDHLNFILTKI